jgi:basic membrane lipoprotein Med (substrate-binding protein (PBP1-ABC) superfamily)
MEKYIKYKRFTKDFIDNDKIQEFFDELITDGWDIIYYQEEPKDVKTLNIVVVVGKRQNKLL